MQSHWMIMFSFLFLFACTNAGSPGKEIRLWPDGPPNAIDAPDYVEYQEKDHILKVTDPTITVYLPPADKATGAAIVICPGGGYWLLAAEHEGYDVAQWLQEKGVAGIVLKYRLPRDQIMENKSIGPLQDVQRAIRMTRHYAEEWHIDPEKIGVMGYSAGGHLAATASTLYDDAVYEPLHAVSARPDFSVLVYPVASFQDDITHQGSRKNLLGDAPSHDQIDHYSNELQIDANTPPAFLVHSIDDEAVPVENTMRYMAALRKHGVSCEVHFYESGGHGYGLNRGQGSEGGWPDALAAWMKMKGLM